MVVCYFSALFFGLFVFQSFFIKMMMGETFKSVFKRAIFPELLSTNMLLAGMFPIIWFWTFFNPEAKDPGTLSFWGMISAACCVGALVCYPINHWLVKHGMKVGMASVVDDSIIEAKPEYLEATEFKKWLTLVETFFGLLVGVLLALTYT
jgi:hypothetical protein